MTGDGTSKIIVLSLSAFNFAMQHIKLNTPTHTNVSGQARLFNSMMHQLNLWPQHLALMLIFISILPMGCSWELIAYLP